MIDASHSAFLYLHCVVFRELCRGLGGHTELPFRYSARFRALHLHDRQ